MQCCINVASAVDHTFVERQDFVSSTKRVEIEDLRSSILRFKPTQDFKACHQRKGKTRMVGQIPLPSLQRIGLTLKNCGQDVCIQQRFGLHQLPLREGDLASAIRSTSAISSSLNPS